MAALGASYIFASLTPDDLVTVMQSMEVVEISSGENIITQGRINQLFIHVAILS